MSEEVNLPDEYLEREYEFETSPGVSEEVVRTISRQKDEPEWMLKKRLRAYEIYENLSLPDWGPALDELDLDEIVYYRRAEKGENLRDWDEVPEDIKETFDRLGIPEAEQEALSGASGQFESEQVYQNMKSQWEDKGVIFCNMDEAVQEHPRLVKEYFMQDCVPPEDNKFAALHGAVWSGGSFLYVPEDVRVELPMQAYFRMNALSQGQFEHTLLIARPGSKVHYIEGCSAPRLAEFSLHSGCVEVFAEKNSSIQYSTVQNWSSNTYNLNTKRAMVGEEAEMRWLSGSLGSKITMLYPASILVGKGASSTNISLSFANEQQILDTGAKMVHEAPDTSSTVNMKTITKDSGQSIYRGLVKMGPEADNSAASVSCDSLLLSSQSYSETIPRIDSDNEKVEIGHEATAGRISEEDLFYMTSRGVDPAEALAMIVKGFVDPVVSELPLEYAVELNRLIQIELENAGDPVDREGYLKDWE